MTQINHHQTMLILDFGSQYTQLIARRIRELGVYTVLFSYDVDPAEIRALAPAGIILSGGPESVTLQDTPRAPDIVFELGCPVLGICYGMQTMAAQLGGSVEVAPEREFGHTEVHVCAANRLLDGIEDRRDTAGHALLDMWMSHGDRVNSLPPGFKLIADTTNTPIAGMADDDRNFYGLLPHIEVTHSRQGHKILARFVYDICGCTATWSTAHILQDAIAKIHQEVQQDEVILALSGGVDSSVVAALLQRAIGNKLTCIFVDTGLLRLNELQQVRDIFGKIMGVNVLIIDAKTRFLTALEGIDEPEQKRKIIGKLFIDVFSEEAKKLGGIKWLAQGTIYSDVIESAKTRAGKSHVIKSHHNVGGLPQDLGFQLLEPLRELFKDEVRKLGLELGLPYDLMYRHPFPGPGLAVRVIGAVKTDYVSILQHADAIFIEELQRHHHYHKVSQAFAVFLPVKSVGVVGDTRQYDYVIGLRAVETIDFMTAQWAQLPYDFLALVSNRICNEVAHVSRVVYDISGKPPATIEWE